MPFAPPVLCFTRKCFPVPSVFPLSSFLSSPRNKKLINIPSLLNVLAVKAYGEAEFWLSGGKVILIFMLFGFTLVTMCGGNPKGDAYGFRYWSNPGSFKEWHTTGDLGRLEGFLAALWSASFTIVGPEYIAIAAAEAKRPSHYLKMAFKTVYARFAAFFILGALCVGIVIPYNDPTLVGIKEGTAEGSGTAAASPYVIAMYVLEQKNPPPLPPPPASPLMVHLLVSWLSCV